MTELIGGSSSTSHLQPGEVARHAAGTCGQDERVRIEAHLASCEVCTEEVVAAWRFGGRRRSHRPWIAVGTVAAALLAGVLLWAPARSSPEGRVVRNGVEHGTDQALLIVSPADRETVRMGARFTWRSRPGVARYKLSITNVDGDSVWATTTADTAVGLPEALPLTTPANYFWYVDALLSEGRSVTSGIHEFRVSP